MGKLVKLKLKNIAYSGDDIGPNFHFTFRVLDKETKVTERIKVGSSESFDHIILNQSVEQDSLSVSLDILEEDPVYDETASHQFAIPLGNLVDAQVHSTSASIEGAGWEKGRKAKLAFDFEVSIDSGIRYIPDADGNGWLRIIPDWIDEKTQLAFTTKVKLTKVDNREYFLIEDGPFRGKTGSVKKKSNGESYLLHSFDYKSSAKLVFERRSQKLTIDGLGQFAAESEVDPIPIGTHDIEIPSARHTDRGSEYLEYSLYAQTWFRTGHSGGYFLHCGEQSAGCITVTETEGWTEIYQFLIRRRKDSLSVGTVEVRD